MTDHLISKQLLNDHRIVKAKELILEAYQEYKQAIDEIKQPDPALTEHYDTLLSKFSRMRGGNLWYPYIGSGIGNGAFVELLDGSIKYDFITGIGVHYLGHSHLMLVESSLNAALSNTIMQGHLQQNEESVLLCELLINAANLDCCFLTTSGVMANENALKIAFQKKFPANRILAFEHCFAGRTLAVSQITDKIVYRQGLPSNLYVDYVPFYDANDPEESTKRAVRILKQHLERYPSHYAAMIMELVQGEGGFYPGSHDFFSQIMEVLKEHEVLTIVDEVQTFGRTPQLFAFQHFELEKYVDIVTIGKSSQACATLFKAELKPKPGLLSQTFTSSSSMIAASYTIIKELLDGDYYGPQGKIQKLHDYFEKKLNALHEKYPALIEGPWGIGAMIAFTPFKGHRTKVTEFSHHLFKEGVICFTAGSDPTRIRFLIPAGAITFEDIDRVMEIVEKVLIREE